MLSRVGGFYNQYPRQFWLLMGVSWVDMVGNWMLFPFFSLYFTAKFGIGLTQVGLIFGVFFIGNFVGQALGGALTDRMGRKRLVLFGLVVSATSSIMMAFVQNFIWMYPVTAFVGIFSNIAQPARQAMIPDLLPSEQHADGFAIFRVVLNMAAAIGPILGGLLVASQGFRLIFFADAGTSLLTAIIFAITLRETRSAQAAEAVEQESMGQTFKGYGRVLRDGPFMAFMGLFMLLNLVYWQLSSTLPVFLRDVQGVSVQRYSYLLATNAVMVVLLQFSITRFLQRYGHMLAMALGALLYGIGFGMFGVVSVYGLLVAAMVTITLGEMAVSPVGSIFAAERASEEMRGRYMAALSLTWILPGLVAPLMAGLVMDNLDPNIVWYFAGAVGLLATVGYLILHNRLAGEQGEAPASPAESSV